MQKTTIHRIRRMRNTMAYDLACAALLMLAVLLIGHVAGSSL